MNKPYEMINKKIGNCGETEQLPVLMTNTGGRGKTRPLLYFTISAARVREIFTVLPEAAA
ncbi:hypothetical protein HMPREF1548_06548 [Clostridium sp. KLE 1755]|nr:hypothetical protein HMPREF1548_06548 [Clostridium sp. KLE 1755]